jgi:hypothetical protein
MTTISYVRVLGDGGSDPRDARVEAAVRALRPGKSPIPD